MAEQRSEVTDLQATAARLQENLRADGPCYSRSLNHKRDHCRDCIMWEASDLLAQLSSALTEAREALKVTEKSLRARGDWLIGNATDYERRPWGGHIRANVLYDFRFFGKKLIEDADRLATLQGSAPAPQETTK